MSALSPQGRSFLKMHGLGNDFVVLDARSQPLVLSAEAVRRIGDRRTGVGFDQMVVVGPTKTKLADAFMTIWNADGSEVSACGNATRCVAWMLMQESGQPHAVIETRAGLLDAQTAAGGLISVDMGPAYLDWRDIPLGQAVDTNHLPLRLEGLTDPVGVGMGNPHAVFFVDDAEAVDLSRLGPILEHDPLFPERCNIEVVQPIGPDRLRMRVWERGAGITLACGTGACATVVAAARRGLIGRSAEVVLDGGTLSIEWMKDNHVLMTGPVALSYSGTLDGSLLP
ncbi:diaminopimelate epimerase [Telmatospirillum siberiense]|uniref:Diaminopimelate epimerase n=1 Tax=Telmatospirillum siberiense TaxID=382514 RepID=A0A2N3PVA3_9PROT|nr:diaminopimelate epimerase [Telmatospirillum siberiense]PKU24329.1 diaminopimelate epimerase [Telmatospirillum siberiense]